VATASLSVNRSVGAEKRSLGQINFHLEGDRNTLANSVQLLAFACFVLSGSIDHSMIFKKIIVVVGAVENVEKVLGSRDNLISAFRSLWKTCGKRKTLFVKYLYLLKLFI
jgi:hypothetical protein